MIKTKDQDNNKRSLENTDKLSKHTKFAIPINATQEEIHRIVANYVSGLGRKSLCLLNFTLCATGDMRCCFFSHSFIAKKVGCSEDHVQRTLCDAKRHGALDYTHRYDNTNIYRIPEIYKNKKFLDELIPYLPALRSVLCLSMLFIGIGKKFDLNSFSNRTPYSYSAYLKSLPEDGVVYWEDIYINNKEDYSDCKTHSKIGSQDPYAKAPGGEKPLKKEEAILISHHTRSLVSDLHKCIASIGSGRHFSHGDLSCKDLEGYSTERSSCAATQYGNLPLNQPEPQYTLTGMQSENTIMPTKRSRFTPMKHSRYAPRIDEDSAKNEADSMLTQYEYPDRVSAFKHYMTVLVPQTVDALRKAGLYNEQRIQQGIERQMKIMSTSDIKLLRKEGFDV